MNRTALPPKSGALPPSVAAAPALSISEGATDPRTSSSSLTLIALRNDGDHYYQTLRHWERNLAARHAEAAALVGEADVENVRRYLRVSAAAFKYRLICLLRMSFAKTA